MDHIRSPLPMQQSLDYNAGPQEQAAADYYQVNRFYILLDAVVTDIKSWIGSHQKSSFLLSKLLDCNLASETWEEFKPTYDNYSVYLENESRVKLEFHFWQKKFCTIATSYERWQKRKTCYKALNMCQVDMFPNILKL